MPAVSVVVKANRDYKRAQAKLDRIARRKLEAAITKGLRASTKDVRRKLKEAPLDALPKRGGLNRWVARTPTVRYRNVGNHQGVSIKITRRGHDLYALERGRLRHPVFYGDKARAQDRKRVWVNQSVPSGWWKRKKKAVEPEALRAIEKTISQAITSEWRKP